MNINRILNRPTLIDLNELSLFLSPSLSPFSPLLPSLSLSLSHLLPLSLSLSPASLYQSFTPARDRHPLMLK